VRDPGLRFEADPAMSNLSTIAPSARRASLAIVDRMFRDSEDRVFRRTDRFFRVLLIVQWAVSVLFAIVVSPRAWEGRESHVHPHVIVALLLGGAFTLLPLVLIKRRPGHWLTRQVVAVSQMGFSCLLIDLTGGRIETHFHVFGSLAFLALYRDWRVLPTATVIVAGDHLLRGIWFPESVYGVPYATAWRSLEHAGWVLFEDIVLIGSCLVSRREMREICERQYQNQELMADLENRVWQRTQELESEVVDRASAEEELRRSEERYRSLIENSPIGIFQMTPQGRPTLVNPRLASMLGYESKAEDSSSCDPATDGAIATEERPGFFQRLSLEGEIHGFETTYAKRDGSEIQMLTNARAVRDGGGSIRCYEGTVEDITERKRAAEELERLNQQLVEASRQAGMADVATGVLHNVGNVLNSVNISTAEVRDRLENSRLVHLRKSVELLHQHGDDLPGFLTNDPRGRSLPAFLEKLADHLEEENQGLRSEMDSVSRHVEHIKQIVSMQQSYARVFGVIETCEPQVMIEDAIHLKAESLERHRIVVERQLICDRKVTADRHKVLQILVNLLGNAKHAIQEANPADRRIVIRVAAKVPDRVCISVSDTGIGISEEHLSMIFRHGFTTKKNGHGFGLHSSVLAAREMSGDLTVHSDGVGRGATFTLELPQG
jgi:PAS domain S-box-containing protein